MDSDSEGRPDPEDRDPREPRRSACAAATEPVGTASGFPSFASVVKRATAIAARITPFIMIDSRPRRAARPASEADSPCSASVGPMPPPTE